MKPEDSLRLRVKQESNLDLYNITYLESAEIFCKGDPFSHGYGTDTPAIMYFARGKGELRLDGLHSTPTIVKPEDYTPEFKENLHLYPRDFIDIIIERGLFSQGF